MEGWAVKKREKKTIEGQTKERYGNVIRGMSKY